MLALDERIAVAPDLDKLRRELKAADREVERDGKRYQASTAKRAKLIVELADAGDSPGAIGRLLGKTTTRMQQILERERR